ncbi:hypothetical protein [Ascidiimonas aurantiaca]|uniref:hypothetical protein n=1 Tax=Ascidiimonas aurantiaca TaxID=1685432 RepID=UPI0030EE85D2
MSTETLSKDFLGISSHAVVSGVINCQSAAPPIGTDPRTALFIALTNMSYNSVTYAIYNNLTGDMISSDTLSKGNSKSVIVPTQDNPNIVRIQNQSPCETGGVAPQLNYSASTQS